MSVLAAAFKMILVYSSSEKTSAILPSYSKWVTPAILLLALGWKLVALFQNLFPFNSDEAIVALMARHINQGARPVFFYGQAYMGSLDAWLVAGGFLLFGEHVWVVRLVQVLLYLLTILLVIQIGRKGLQSQPVGWLAGIFLAVPAVNTYLYTTVSLGGYGEALLIGAGLLLVSFVIDRNKNLAYHLLWGFLAGLGLWANGLSMVFVIPSGLLLLQGLFRKQPGRNIRQIMVVLLLVLFGIFAGASPWWMDALRQGPANLVSELAGSAVAVESSTWLARTGTHLVNLVLFGMTAFLGMRPPWEIRWLALPLLPFVLVFSIFTFFYLFRCAGRPGPQRRVFIVLAGVVVVLAAGFLFTPFGVDPSGRYFLPLIIPFSLAAARLILTSPVKKGLRVLLAPLLILFYGWGTLQCALMVPPGFTTQFYTPSQIDHRYDTDLIQFLREHNETRGYSNYWVSYPLAFQTAEEIVFVPVLPYHPDLSYTARDNRYAPYDTLVASGERTAFINTRLPEVDTALRAGFQRLGVDWKEETIGDYQIYYGLSRPVRPEEIGFGGSHVPAGE